MNDQEYLNNEKAKSKSFENKAILIIRAYERVP